MRLTNFMSRVGKTLGRFRLSIVVKLNAALNFSPFPKTHACDNGKDNKKTDYHDGNNGTCPKTSSSFGSGDLEGGCRFWWWFMC